ncbi:guanylate kinase [Sediminibacterium sp.]|uniref:guanylate kinase n=1 Tax=Sediminibacterium sp. TaxID=1917865 RepID=UPI0027336E1F|nr:guanylate kinase [Sediminibacterium sp.]MDP3394680.1 guanylate kinase [Sediminibacterium sp.]MDP3568515.1 guanylate kinase [Sediminibacterium sp.]
MTADSRKIIIIAAPSGSGKTSITRFLLQKYPALCLSVSAATRKPRGEEKDGVHYHFISEEDFKHKIEENAFVEWEMVYEGSYYGTLKAELERIWNLGKTPILDIDVKGAIHLQDQFPNRCLSIFIEPPSVAELKNRLESRGTETPESLANRVNKASYELSFKNHFHKNILNDNLERACKETEEVIKEFLGWQTALA